MKKYISTKVMVHIAKEASALVGSVIKRKAYFGTIGIDAGGVIGKGGDLAKHGDLAAERVVMNYLSQILKRGMVDKVILISEESGIREFTSIKKVKEEKSIFLILDPIDGSNNMRPWWTPRAHVGCSLALGNCDRLNQDPTISAVEVGWVRDIFYDCNYYAIRNKGAFFTSSDQKTAVKLKTGRTRRLAESLIAVSLDTSQEKFERALLKLKPILKQKKCQRRLGSTVLDLSKVACGEFDAFISVSGNIKIHDIAAMKLIIKEAGGFFWLQQVRGAENKRYLYDLIFEKKDHLIREVGFEVIATSTKFLFNDIKKFLK